MYLHIGLSPWPIFQGLLHAISAEGPLNPWKTWPFDIPGLDTPFVVIAAKGLFLFAILAGLALFLRWLFGPGGPLREPWMDEKSDEEPDVKPDEKSDDQEP